MKFAKISLAVTLALAAGSALAQTMSIPTPADSATPGGRAVVAITTPQSVPLSNFSNSSGKAGELNSWTSYFIGQNKDGFYIGADGAIYSYLVGMERWQSHGIPLGNTPISFTTYGCVDTTYLISPGNPAYMNGPPATWNVSSTTVDGNICY